MKNSPYLHRFRTILSFLWSAGAMSVFDVAVYATCYHYDIGPIVIVISLACMAAFIFLHVFLGRIWQKYYFEAKTAQAFNRKEAVIVYALDSDIKLKFNFFSCGLSVAAYVLIVLNVGISATIGIWLASILLVAYLVALYWLVLSYVASRTRNFEHADEYVLIAVVDELNLDQSYRDAVTVANAPRVIKDTLQDFYERYST